MYLLKIRLIKEKNWKIFILEYDLLFTVINNTDWKVYTESGLYTPKELKEHGFFKCFEGKFVEPYANLNYKHQNQLLLLVIDPLRINEPIKKFIDVEVEYYSIHGKISTDAIIDRIKLKKSKNGTFNIRIKHFD